MRLDPPPASPGCPSALTCSTIRFPPTSGSADRTPPWRRSRAAAKTARLDEFIRSLPEGYDTVIGEGGARLSGGQAQRLALARAFLLDAPILLLDEPSSSLDPETETLLDESTRSLMQGRTVITIAHRLNTVFHADRIIVLDRGTIVESGTHAELLAKNGKYAGMVKAGIAEVEGKDERGRKKEGVEEPRDGSGEYLSPQPVPGKDKNSRPSCSAC